MIRALGKWCQVGRRRMEKGWDGYSSFSKACPLKERQPLKKLNPAQDFIRPQSRHPGHDQRLEGTIARGLRSEDIEVRLGFESLALYDLGLVIKPQFFSSVKWDTDPKRTGF